MPFAPAVLSALIMIDTINVLATLVTIGFGLFGFLAPRYTAAALDLKPDGSTMGLSEMRASVGGLFVVMGLAALWLQHPLGFAMIGFGFVGAVAGRGLSLFIDKPPVRNLLIFAAVEGFLAAWFLAANL
ncbi:MAG: DUF4345 family protein [Sulfitobacter sp.]